MLGVPAPGLLFRGGRSGPHFLSRGCFVFVIGVYCRFAIRGSDYKRFLYPRRFPINVKWYRKDGCVLVVWVSFVELVGDESIFYVSSEMFLG